MKKAIKIIILLIIILLIIFIGYNMTRDDDDVELIEISSKAELEAIYNRTEGASMPFRLLTLPFSVFDEISYPYYRSIDSITNTNQSAGMYPSDFTADSASTTDSITTTQPTKEYSTTNIQVENVDEADITKTDGDYIYSLSEEKVIITDVRDENQIKIASEIEQNDSDIIPIDLILYNNKLVVISEEIESSAPYYYKNYNNITFVSIYDISDKENPKEVKNYQLEQTYYTSRCIDGKLYVISSGYLKEENDEIVTYYYEDGEQIDQS